ncbi:MAG: hypothetical protein JXA95_07880 [Spirochaetales bacterium]|nr:hypothetical protein [Spirochaetales bacterium]
MGDEQKDIHCAREAQVHSILICRGKVDWQKEFTISKLSDIPAILIL